MKPLFVTRKSHAIMSSHTSKQCNSLEWPSEDPTGARKRVAKQRNIVTIMPAPETLQEFPRQEAAEDAAQRNNHRYTHLDPQEEGSDGARRTTKPGTEWVAKPRNAVRHETVRVNIGYLRVVNELEHTHSPRTLGIDDKLLTKFTCVERNGVSSWK